MSTFAEMAADLNAAILLQFGESVVIRQGLAEDATVTVAWMQSDTADRRIQIQAKLSSFAAPPKAGDKVIRGANTYRIQEPEYRDGDWIVMELRLLAPGQA